MAVASGEKSMMQGITGGGQNLGFQGLDALGIGQQGQGGVQDAMKLLKQLADMLGINEQSGAKSSGCQGGKCQGAGGAQGGGGEAGGLEDLLRKLREMAQQNPQAVQQALGQMPGLANALSGAMMGGGGGPTGAGMAMG